MATIRKIMELNLDARLRGHDSRLGSAARRLRADEAGDSRTPENRR